LKDAFSVKQLLRRSSPR